LSIEERVDELEAHLSRVDALIREVEIKADQDRADHQQALNDTREALTASIAALQAELDARQERAVQVDARALAVTVIGILLLNFAPEVASLPPVAWLLALAGFVALSVGFGRSAWAAGSPAAETP
jgi:hypothetical protein